MLHALTEGFGPDDDGHIVRVKQESSQSAVERLARPCVRALFRGATQHAGPALPSPFLRRARAVTKEVCSLLDTTCDSALDLRDRQRLSEALLSLAATSWFVEALRSEHGDYAVAVDLLRVHFGPLSALAVQLPDFNDLLDQWRVAKLKGMPGATLASKEALFRFFTPRIERSTAQCQRLAFSAVADAIDVEGLKFAAWVLKELRGMRMCVLFGGAGVFVAMDGFRQRPFSKPRHARFFANALCTDSLGVEAFRGGGFRKCFSPAFLPFSARWTKGDARWRSVCAKEVAVILLRFGAESPRHPSMHFALLEALKGCCFGDVLDLAADYRLAESPPLCQFLFRQGELPPRPLSASDIPVHKWAAIALSLAILLPHGGVCEKDVARRLAGNSRKGVLAAALIRHVRSFPDLRTGGGAVVEALEATRPDRVTLAHTDLRRHFFEDRSYMDAPERSFWELFCGRWCLDAVACDVDPLLKFARLAFVAAGLRFGAFDCGFRDPFVVDDLLLSLVEERAVLLAGVPDSIQATACGVFFGLGLHRCGFALLSMWNTEGVRSELRRRERVFFPGGRNDFGMRSSFREALAKAEAEAAAAAAVGGDGGEEEEGDGGEEEEVVVEGGWGEEETKMWEDEGETDADGGGGGWGGGGWGEEEEKMHEDEEGEEGSEWVEVGETGAGRESRSLT